MSRFIELHLNDSDSTPVIVNIDKMLQFKKMLYLCNQV